MPLQQPYEFGALGTRADEAHVSHENVEKLRQLVEPGATQPFADPGDTRVAKDRPDRTRDVFGVGPHRSEFVENEDAPILTDTLLAKEHRAPRVDFDRERDERHQRQRQRQPDDREDEVHGALQGSGQLGLHKAV